MKIQSSSTKIYLWVQTKLKLHEERDSEYLEVILNIAKRSFKCIHFTEVQERAGKFFKHLEEKAVSNHEKLILFSHASTIRWEFTYDKLFNFEW